MEQKSNVQLNSKCKIIDISQKYSCRGNPNFLFGGTTQNRCGKTPERYCATGCSCLLFRWCYPDLMNIGYFTDVDDDTMRLGTFYYAGGIYYILRQWLTEPINKTPQEVAVLMCHFLNVD